jgi:Trypsin
MMRRGVMLAAIALLAALVLAAPAGAITYGTRDGDRHPEVGALLAPGYTQAQNDPHDIAVVVLDQPVTGITPARLPAAGSLDGLRVGTRFTSVGYGAQSVSIDHGPSFHYADVRYMATGGLLAVNPSWLRISMNPARGDGGTCYGDSGGPNFLGAGPTETDIVAAITITGDAMCRATNMDYRLDTPSARAFLSQYVTLP